MKVITLIKVKILRFDYFKIYSTRAILIPKDSGLIVPTLVLQTCRKIIVNYYKKNRKFSQAFIGILIK